MIRKILMLLLPLLISGLLTAATPREQEAADLLLKTKTLLEEERTRWKAMHETPYDDEVTLSQTNDELKISIIIDPKVQNIINDQPLTREYTFPKTEQHHDPLFPDYFGVCGLLAYPSGFRPMVYGGYKLPFQKNTFIKRLAVGPYLSYIHVGVAVSYIDPALHNLTVAVTFGVNYDMRMMPGIGVGISF